MPLVSSFVSLGRAYQRKPVAPNGFSVAPAEALRQRRPAPKAGIHRHSDPARTFDDFFPIWVFAMPKLLSISPLTDRASDTLVGNSSTVERRTLTPLILVRIQVPQPILPKSRDFYVFPSCGICAESRPAKNSLGTGQRPASRRDMAASHASRCKLCIFHGRRLRLSVLLCVCRSGLFDTPHLDRLSVLSTLPLDP